MIILTLFMSGLSARCAGPSFLSLPDSNIALRVPVGWTIMNKDEEIGMYSLDQPAKGPRSRIHFSRDKNGSTSLESAIETEIDRITKRSPAWGSSNDRRSYKGSTAITTDSGLTGMRANFYYDEPNGRQYTIVKYYFFDEHGRIFRVCAHIGGDETRFKLYDHAILSGLTSAAPAIWNR